jgi:hypothetical protein
MLDRCQLRFGFEFGHVDQRRMNLKIVVDGQEPCDIVPENQRAAVTIDIVLPTTVRLEFSNKNYNTDTILDQQGRITDDVHVKIQSMSLDNFEFDELFLHQKIKLTTDQQQTVISCYIGFNGAVTFDFACSDVFSQYLLLKSQ